MRFIYAYYICLAAMVNWLINTRAKTRTSIINKYSWGRTVLNTIEALILVATPGVPTVYYGVPTYFHEQEQNQVVALEKQEGLDKKNAALNWLAKVEKKYDLLEGNDIKRDLTDLCYAKRIWNASYQEVYTQHWDWWSAGAGIKSEENPYLVYVEKKLNLLKRLDYLKSDHQSIKDKSACFGSRHPVISKDNFIKFGNRPNGGKGLRVKNDQSLFLVARP